MKRVCIIHGWGGSPNEPMHIWLTSQLRKNGYEVIVPEMPEPEAPIIEDWVEKLKDIVGEPDADTILVGHSIGCQTILRYLETLEEASRVGGIVLIAPWLTLQDLGNEEEQNIAKPWLETPILFADVRKHVSKIAAIFSDNDPVVSIENAGLFKQKFGTENIIEHGKGHFTEEEGVTELPSALEAILALK